MGGGKVWLLLRDMVPAVDALSAICGAGGVDVLVLCTEPELLPGSDSNAVLMRSELEIELPDSCALPISSRSWPASQQANRSMVDDRRPLPRLRRFLTSSPS